MKTTIKMFAAIIICAFTIAITSCTENPIDKKIDEINTLVTKLDKITKEKNPSAEELKSIKRDYEAMQESLMSADIDESKITASQKERLMKIAEKASNIQYNPGFEKLNEMEP